MKALVVDNDAAVRGQVREALRARGHEVTVCEDSETALAAWREHRHPLVVIDWSPRGTDGISLCRAIRALPGADGTVILMLADETETGDLHALLAAGADDYVIKPLDECFLSVRLALAEKRVQDHLHGAGRKTLAESRQSGILEVPGKVDRHKYRIRLKSSVDQLSAARKFLRKNCEQCRGAGLDDQGLAELELAFAEATTNIMRHAYGGRDDQPVEIEIEVSPEAIQVRLYDWGDPFDPATVDAPVFDGTRTGGFGLFIIQQAVDEVSYSRHEGRNGISLTKRLKQGQEPRAMIESSEQVGDVTVVTLQGDDLDASNVPEFNEEVTPVIEGSKKVLIDMGNLKFVDSSGLGAMLNCLRQINGRGGDLKLCRMTEPVRVLFDLVRMQRLFDIFETREEAMAAFK